MAPLTGGSGEEGTGWLEERIKWPLEHYPLLLVIVVNIIFQKFPDG